MHSAAIRAATPDCWPRTNLTDDQPIPHTRSRNQAKAGFQRTSAAQRCCCPHPGSAQGDQVGRARPGSVDTRGMIADQARTSKQTSTGAKISSVHTSMSMVTLARMVGPRKLPASCPGTTAPRPSSAHSAPCGHGPRRVSARACALRNGFLRKRYRSGGYIIRCIQLD
jgi:hypothetical protein